MVMMLLSSYPLDLWTVMNCGRRDRADPVQSNFIISEVIVINLCLFGLTAEYPSTPKEILKSVATRLRRHAECRQS